MPNSALQSLVQKYPFPDVSLANDQGLLAIGGDLLPNRIISAYCQGVFPWFGLGEPILWWSPDPRCVINVRTFSATRSLKKNIRKYQYYCTFDKSFSQIIDHCAKPTSARPETWLSPTMCAAYSKLHDMNYAHSVETWYNGQLVGGLYGLAIGRVFYGESMFSNKTDASKTALWSLVQHLKQTGFSILDCQVTSKHLLSLGAITISRAEFIRQIKHAVYFPEKAKSWKTFNTTNSISL